MSDLPKSVEIHEEGPREGFQIEPGPIATADKIRLIEALAETGIPMIGVASRPESTLLQRADVAIDAVIPKSFVVKNT
mgnify:CR=1 FL=1